MFSLEVLLQTLNSASVSGENGKSLALLSKLSHLVQALSLSEPSDTLLFFSLWGMAYMYVCIYKVQNALDILIHRPAIEGLRNAPNLVVILSSYLMVPDMSVIFLKKENSLL